MHTATHRYEIGLAARSLFEIPDAASVQIHCSRGSLWITLDNDTRDVVLEPGESFSTNEHRRALLYALRPSCFAVQAAAATDVQAASLRMPPRAVHT